MKLLLLSSVFAISTFASNCFKSADIAFIEATPNYEFHFVSSLYNTYKAHTPSYSSYGTKIDLGYDFDVISYQASNEHWGGLGVYEIVVNPTSCQVLKIIEVYTE